MAILYLKEFNDEQLIIHYSYLLKVFYYLWNSS